MWSYFEERSSSIKLLVLYSVTDVFCQYICQITVMELSLFNNKCCYAKFDYVWCVLSQAGVTFYISFLYVCIAMLLRTICPGLSLKSLYGIKFVPLRNLPLLPRLQFIFMSNTSFNTIYKKNRVFQFDALCSHNNHRQLLLFFKWPMCRAKQRHGSNWPYPTSHQSN